MRCSCACTPRASTHRIPKRRAGWRKEGLEFPKIVPHSDGAGVIEAVGRGVDPGRVGERVWLYNAQRGRAFGTCAEYCTLAADLAIPLPASTSFAEAACLGVPAQTAHFAVTCDGDLRGQTVLVQGGAGAVGHYAIQWAKRSGARVITTVSKDEKAANAREAGADHVIDRKRADVIAAVLDLAPSGVERIVEVDLGANLAIDVAVIAENGTIASYSSTAVPEPVLPYYPLAYKGVTLHLVQVYILPSTARAAAIRDIGEALAEGKLIHTIAATFPLEQTAKAHVLAESPDHIGNVVVQIGASDRES